VFGDFGDDVKPIIQAGGSDSAALDNVFEVLVRAGRDAPMAKTLLVPEAWVGKTKDHAGHHRRTCSYCNSVMEPWDGPAALAPPTAAGSSAGWTATACARCATPSPATGC
jgi:glutamate synthase (NADPH/NADH) large chain